MSNLNKKENIKYQKERMPSFNTYNMNRRFISGKIAEGNRVKSLLSKCLL